jgi:hypothetical protein
VSDSFNDSTLDIVTLSPDGSTVCLYIVQAGPWTGSDAQLDSLQLKIHNYLSYALDGQLEQTYPELAGHPWRIVIDCQTGPPDPSSAKVLAYLAETLPKYGGSLQIRNS